MKRVADQLANLINYDELSQIRLLALPRLEKKQVPKLIASPSYDKAMLSVERTMERYTQKVKDLEERLHSSDQNISSLKRAFHKVDPGKGFFVDRKNPEAVDRYNNRLEEAKRLTDRINDAVDKHNDLVEKRDDAVREANDRLEELKAQALLAIDDDIVAALDKCTKVAEKLAGSQNSEDLAAALEIALQELKMFALFEELIEGNDARKACRERVAIVYRIFGELSANEHVRNHLADLYRRNAHLVEQNAALFGQVAAALGGIDQSQLDGMTSSVATVTKKAFETTFAYQGVVDPAKLDAIVVQIKNTISSMQQAVQEATGLAASTGAAAQAAGATQQNVAGLLATMQANVEAMSEVVLSEEHFACEIVNEAVIDEFLHRDLRPQAKALRDHLAKALGEEQVDALVGSQDDRYALKKAEEAIARADLLRLEREREKVAPFVEQLTTKISGAEADIKKAGEVPQQNANSLEQQLGTQYLLSCIPVIGVVSGVVVSSRVSLYQPAFRSPNPIYRDLGTRLVMKNAGAAKRVIVLAPVIGVVAVAGVYFAAHAMAAALIAGAVTAASYLITGALLSSAGKNLRSFLGLTDAPAPGELSPG